MWAAENLVRPYEVEDVLSRPEPVRERWPAPKPRRPFMVPTPKQKRLYREDQQRQRERAAEGVLGDPLGMTPEGRKAKKRLIQTAPPKRQMDLLRGPQVPGKVASKEELFLLGKIGEIERKPRKTDEDRERIKELKGLIALKPWEPSAAGRVFGGAIYGALGGVQTGGKWLWEHTLPEEHREAELARFRLFQERSTRASKWVSDRLVTKPGEAGALEQTFGFELPEGLRQTGRKTIRSLTESIIGAPAGLIYTVAKPQEAVQSYEQFARSYYGALARGETEMLEREGIAPLIFDPLALAAGGAGAVTRAGALGRTAAFRGPLELTPGGKAISRPEAYGRAAIFGQQPVPILGTESMTMGRVVPIHFKEREQPVAKGEAIQVGDRIEYRRDDDDDIRSFTVDEKSALVGVEAPDINDPLRIGEGGAQPLTVIGVQRMQPHVQRMVPRSPVGQFISAIYNRVRPDTGRREGIFTGKGRRRKLLRQDAEVREDRQRGRIAAFVADSRRIQKDVVLSTAYDRMLRYRDPVAGVDAEIAARRQRGLDKTVEQQQVLAALERAREHVANPSPELDQAVAGGRILSQDTENFLVTRGMLSQERAATAKVAAERWLREGHIEDEPLSSPRRDEVEGELRDHFGATGAGLTQLAMGWTDTLARAWGAVEKRDPADWYEENIRSVESLTPEQMGKLDQDSMLAQDRRDFQRTPNAGETFALRDPESGKMRVARMVGQGFARTEVEPGTAISVLDPEHSTMRIVVFRERRGDMAVVEWQREPRQGVREEIPWDEQRMTVSSATGRGTIEWVYGEDAGTRLDLPIEEIKGNTSMIHGWYSALANEVELMPEKFGKQEAASRLKKAPGVKADEWKWLKMDEVLDNLFPPGVRSVTRAELRAAIRTGTLRFETRKLGREESYYETNFSVTLDGPLWDYEEGLIYYPGEHYGPTREEIREAAYEKWMEEKEETRVAAEAAVEDARSDLEDAVEQLEEVEPGTTERYDWEVEVETYQERLDEAEVELSEVEGEINEGPDDYELEGYEPEREMPLYSADHFAPDHGPNQYADDVEDLSENLMAWSRTSGRWLGGAPIRVIEEGQSDIHQQGRAGYRTAEAQQLAHDAEDREGAAHNESITANQNYLAAFVKKLQDQDIHVRELAEGEQGFVKQGEYGMTPEFKVVIREGEAPWEAPATKYIEQFQPGDEAWTLGSVKGRIMIHGETGRQAFFADEAPSVPVFDPVMRLYVSDPWATPKRTHRTQTASEFGQGDVAWTYTGQRGHFFEAPSGQMRFYLDAHPNTPAELPSDAVFYISDPDLPPPVGGRHETREFRDLEPGTEAWTSTGRKGLIQVSDFGGKTWYPADGGPSAVFAPRMEMYLSDPTKPPPGGYARQPDTEEISVRRNYSYLEPTSDQNLRDLFDEMRQKQADYEDRAHEARQARTALRGPPEIPWQGAQWEELLFREAVRDAVARGETRIAWTTGEQQAERYNKLLARHVERVEWDGDNLYVFQKDGGTQTYHASNKDALVDHLGTAMANKLEAGLPKPETLPEPEFDLFRVERPSGDYGTTTMRISISETEAGDVIWVGGQSPAQERRALPFNVRVDPDTQERFVISGSGTWKPVDRWEYEDYLPEPDAEGRGSRWPSREFAAAARRIQEDQFKDYGERPAGTGAWMEREQGRAVLEGEDISVGGGGFIDAYDRRWRSYAKKYLKSDPYLVELDDLHMERISYLDVGHPSHVPLTERWGWSERDLMDWNEAMQETPDVYRISAGGKLLAESESLYSALQSVYHGGPDEGHWPTRIRFIEPTAENGYVGGWAAFNRGGQRGGTAPTYENRYGDLHDTAQAAIREIERYRDIDVHIFDGDGFARAAEGKVWVVDIPEAFATALHIKGSPLMQRRRGSVLGLTRLTDEGANVYLDRDAADIATWVEESAHAVIPDWFDAADARRDPRGDYLRQQAGLGPGAAITNEANEFFVDLLKVWLHQGATPSPQLRSLFQGLSGEMRTAYRQGARSIIPDEKRRKKIERLLDDPAVTSFLRDQFDVAPMKDFDPGAVAFQTMKPVSRFSRASGGKLLGPVRLVDALAPEPGQAREHDAGMGERHLRRGAGGHGPLRERRASHQDAGRAGSPRAPAPGAD